MALEESRPVPRAPVATPGPTTPSGTALRGTQAISLTPVQEQWGSTLDREGTAAARMEAAVQRLTRSESIEGIDPSWVAFVCRELQVCAIYLQTAHDVVAGAARRCEWGPISRSFDMQAAMHARQAQALVLYTMDLERIVGVIPIDEARARWEASSGWTAVRRVLTAIAVREDWGETLIAMNLCVDALVGQMIRREWGITLAEQHADPLMPVLARPTQVRQAWIRDWTHHTIKSACARPRDGGANRALIQGWVREWSPRAREAACELAGLTADLPVERCGIDAYDRLVREQDDTLDQLNLRPHPAG